MLWTLGKSTPAVLASLKGLPRIASSSTLRPAAQSDHMLDLLPDLSSFTPWRTASMEGRDEGTDAPSMIEAAFNISSMTALMCSRVSTSNAKA